MATRKGFNISLPSREIYGGYQILILRQEPPVKARTENALREGASKAKGRLRRNGI